MNRLPFILGSLLVLACETRPKPAPPPAPAPARPSASAAASPSLDRATFARLFAELSEPDRGFMSSNYVSNETSYLQVAPELTRRVRPGQAYVGVGPEQNFTYLALTRPSVAFIVDIRRENAILHLLYRACFEAARSRSEFLTLLLGRPYQPAGDPGPGASIDAVFLHAERLAPDAAQYEVIHAALERRIEVPLSPADRETLARTHRAFFQGQLATRFELEQSGRHYPSLREILAAVGPDGKPGGFLTSEAAFRFVQGLEVERRVIPVVGDFSGEHALRAVAAEIRRQQLTVGVFYVSNVEQYVLEPPAWGRYFANVAALPTDASSLLLRCYLDQGRRHPRQLPGHRTATVLQPVSDFLGRWRPPRRASFFEVATEGML